MNKLLLPVLLLASVAVHAHGTETLHPDSGPVRIVDPEIRVLQSALNRDRDDLRLLSTLVGRYLDLGRRQSDESYFEQARLLLQPYMDRRQMDPALLLQWADILQRTHQFRRSRRVLDQLLQSDPGNARARLMRAVVLQSMGRYSEARRDCIGLLGHTEMLLVSGCVAQVEGLTGSLENSTSLLKRVLTQYPEGAAAEDRESVRWVSSLLAEMSLRSGDWSTAQHYMQAILSEYPDDQYMLALYADELLARKQFVEALSLLQDSGSNVKLLLRRVLAQQGLGRVESGEHIRLQQYMERLLEHGDAGDAGVLSRYYLDVARDSRRALGYAVQNWAVQRNPADVLLLRRCLASEPDQVVQSRLQAWIRSNNYQDSRLAEIVGATPL